MKKYFSVALIPTALLFLGAGCADNATDVTLTTANNAANAVDVPGKPTASMIVPEAGVTVHFPNEYRMIRSTEANRRGSFVSYEFLGTTGTLPYPRLAEIQFFTDQSIQRFSDACKDTLCFEGDAPTSERYSGQRQALEAKTDFEQYTFKVVNELPVLVSTFPCTGDTCSIREYTTFFKGTKVDVWILMENESQTDAADELFRSMKLVYLL